MHHGCMERHTLPWWGAIGFAVAVLGLVGLLTPSGDPERGVNLVAVVALVAGLAVGAGGLLVTRRR